MAVAEEPRQPCSIICLPAMACWRVRDAAKDPTITSMFGIGPSVVLMNPPLFGVATSIFDHGGRDGAPPRQKTSGPWARPLRRGPV